MNFNKSSPLPSLRRAKRVARVELNYVSLFSGSGGLDFGFIAQGFNCLAAYDLNPHAVQTHSLNYKAPAHVYDLSTSDLNTTNYNAKIDLVIAGPPCQGFSLAGKRIVNDPRNLLLNRAAQIGVNLNARVIVIENVKGVLSGEHSNHWKSMKSFLSSSGYDVVECSLNALSFGIPQMRRRMLIIAFRGKDIRGIEFNQHAPNIPLSSAITNIDASTSDHDMNPLTLNSKDWNIAKRILPGMKLCNVRGGPRSIHTWDIPEVFGKVSLREKDILTKLVYLRRRIRQRLLGDSDPVHIDQLQEHYSYNINPYIDALLRKEYIKRNDEYIDLRQTFNGKYRRLQMDKPAYTVDTRFTSPKYFLHPLEDRGFTLREAARIQGFPDDFMFAGTVSARARLVGDAVPPPMSYAIASVVRKLLLEGNRDGK